MFHENICYFVQILSLKIKNWEYSYVSSVSRNPFLLLNQTFRSEYRQDDDGNDKY